MFFYEGQSCPVCGEYFVETDDIVSCPTCGAPHHRNCWQQEGHCHFETDHGTDRQWPAGQSSAAKKQEPAAPTRNCPNCGTQNPEFAEFCAHCGRHLDAAEWNTTPPPPRGPVNHYTPPFQSQFTPPPINDPLGGIPRSETIDGISVETIAEVVGVNSAYYLPRFYRMSRENKKISFNLSAFLFTAKWLLYRKNLLIGWLTFVFEFALTFFTYYANYQAEELGTSFLLTQQGKLLQLILLIVSGATVALCVLLGLFGNWIYMQHVLKKARKLQEEPDLQYNQNFVSTGGVSFAMAVLPYALLTFAQYLLLLISGF